jgi:phage baseplate assembly protein W
MATIIAERNRVYKDLSLSMGMNPVTNDVLTVTDAEAVKRSVKTLLMTLAGEVPFFLRFGAGFYQLLFEPLDAITLTLLDAEIRNVIAAFEPRVRIVTLQLTPNEDANSVQVDLTLQILNLTEPVTLTVILSRVR